VKIEYRYNYPVEYTTGFEETNVEPGPAGSLERYKI
jgi:hypothetical protein